MIGSRLYRVNIALRGVGLFEIYLKALTDQSSTWLRLLEKCMITLIHSIIPGRQ